jgi:hypothetical protein
MTWEQDCLNYNPFGGGKGDDGVERILSDAMRTCRKPRQCCICFYDTVPRTRIRVQSAIVDGHLVCCTMCEACCRAMALSWTDNGDAIGERTSIGMAAALATPRGGM